MIYLSIIRTMAKLTIQLVNHIYYTMPAESLGQEQVPFVVLCAEGDITELRAQILES